MNEKLRTALLATTIALTVGAGMTTGASAHGFGGHFGGGHFGGHFGGGHFAGHFGGGHWGGWGGHRYAWGYGHRWGWGYGHGWGWNYAPGYYAYRLCPYGQHYSYTYGVCVLNYTY